MAANDKHTTYKYLIFKKIIIDLHPSLSRITVGMHTYLVAFSIQKSIFTQKYNTAEHELPTSHKNVWTNNRLEIIKDINRIVIFALTNIKFLPATEIFGVPKCSKMNLKILQ